MKPRTPSALSLLVVLLAASLLAGCQTRNVAEMDKVYFSWNGRRVLCGLAVDDDLPDGMLVSLDNLGRGMDRALERDQVLVLYGHEPGGDVSHERLEAVLALVVERGLPFFTFDELDGPPLGAGVSLSFDDSTIDSWHAERPLFNAYGARVTFFVARFPVLSTWQLDMLRELRDDGHDIESHGASHVDAAEYVEEHGLRAYIDDEVRPSLEAMRREGFTPMAYAYPFGVRTSEIDRAVLQHVTLVRSIARPIRTAIIADPCPE